MEKPPIPSNIALSSGQVNYPWSVWFERLQEKFNRCGSTAKRPITGVEIGDMYMDKTLGIPIWALSINPVVWVKADGTIV